MRYSANNALSDIRVARRTLVEFFLVVVLTAFAVNLMSNTFSHVFSTFPTLQFAFGLFLCLVSVAYSLSRLFSKRVVHRKVDAILLHHLDNHQCFPMPRYPFSRDMSKYFASAFKENPALQSAWSYDGDPIPNFLNALVTESSVLLIREAVEFYLLDNLSSQLAHHFGTLESETSRVKIFRRSDMPDILLSNRFLELFSRSMEDRVSFIDYVKKIDVRAFNITKAYHNGSIYQDFTLTLPEGSIVRRLDDGSLGIDTKHFVLSIDIDLPTALGSGVGIEGKKELLPYGYIKYCLGRSPDEFIAYSLCVSLQVSFKNGALLTGSGLDYYRWIDTYLNCVEEAMSYERHLDEIDFNAALTIFTYFEKSGDVDLPFSRDVIRDLENRSSSS